jgi:hypothetical protein
MKRNEDEDKMQVDACSAGPVSECNLACKSTKMQHAWSFWEVESPKNGAPNEYTDQAEQEIDHHIQEPATALAITHMY